jgi:cell division protease FtsH
VSVQARTEETPLFATLLIYLIPWVLIIGFFMYSSRKLQGRMGGAGGLFGFGKSKAKLFTKSSSNVTFKDVAGLSNAKKEFTEIVDFLKNPAKYKAIGAKLPKGVLLAGPPGTGKTLMSRAVAGEADVPFYSISGSEFIEMFVGVGASRVRDMFDNAKKDAPAIIFIDELDSIGRVRGTGLGGGHDEREQTLNQILAEMDGFDPHLSVIVIAATNRPDVLDPALVRPGRFDRQITLDLPQRNARKEILQLHSRQVPLAESVDFDNLARRTVGFSGAELMNLVNEAALLAARKGKKRVDSEDFDQGMDKIVMGLEREELIGEEEKKSVAYHEAGHALLAKLLPGADPLKKVSIIPRGRALGATEQLPEEDRHNLGRQYLLNRIAILLGGRVAEKLVFDDITTGAGDDLKRATHLARRMVCQWGMSEEIGPVTFQRGDQHPFLGREITEPKDFSEETAKLIDDEVRGILRGMEQRSEKVLREHREDLNTLAQALLEHESLLSEDVDRLLPHLQTRK